MKICKNELLLWGGTYQCLAFVISLFGFNLAYAIGSVLYMLFWLIVFAIVFHQVPNIVYVINEKFPRISVFFASIGWIPYFTTFYILLTWGIDIIVIGSNSVSVFLNNYVPMFDIYLSAIFISLFWAAYKVLYRKEKLAMMCDVFNKY